MHLDMSILRSSGMQIHDAPTPCSHNPPTFMHEYESRRHNHECDPWRTKATNYDNPFFVPPPFQPFSSPSPGVVSSLPSLSPNSSDMFTEPEFHETFLNLADQTEDIRNKNIFMPILDPPIMPTFQCNQVPKERNSTKIPEELNTEVLHIPDHHGNEEFQDLFDSIAEVRESKLVPRFHTTLFSAQATEPAVQITQQILPTLTFHKEEPLTEVKREVVDPAYCESPTNVVPSMEGAFLPDFTVFNSLESNEDDFSSKNGWTGTDPNNSDGSNDCFLKFQKRPKSTARSVKPGRRGRRPRVVAEENLDINTAESQFSMEDINRQYGLEMEKLEEGSDDDDITGLLLKCRWLDCEGTFTNQLTLVKHIEKSHVEHRRGEEFSCFWEGCSRRSRPFNARYKLLIHMRVHSGEKPNKCPVKAEL